MSWKSSEKKDALNIRPSILLYWPTTLGVNFGGIAILLFSFAFNLYKIVELLRMLLAKSAICNVMSALAHVYLE